MLDLLSSLLMVQLQNGDMLTFSKGSTLLITETEVGNAGGLPWQMIHLDKSGRLHANGDLSWACQGFCVHLHVE